MAAGIALHKRFWIFALKEEDSQEDRQRRPLKSGSLGHVVGSAGDRKQEEEASSPHFAENDGPIGCWKAVRFCFLLAGRMPRNVI